MSCSLHIYIHYHLRDKTHRSHHVLIKRAHQTPFLLTLSPFPLFLHWRSPLPFCLLFLFPSSSISWAMLAVRISFCNLDFIGCHVLDIRSGHIYLQGQYSLYFFPFVWSIFFVIFFALVVLVFNAFLVIIFLPLPGFQSYKGAYFPVRLPALSLERRLFLYCPHSTTLSFRLHFPSFSFSFWWIP